MNQRQLTNRKLAGSQQQNLSRGEIRETCAALPRGYAIWPAVSNTRCAASPLALQGPARPPFWEVPWREVRVMREVTLLRASRRQIALGHRAHCCFSNRCLALTDGPPRAQLKIGARSSVRFSTGRPTEPRWGGDVGVESGWAPEWEWWTAPVVRATASEEAVARASPVA